MTELTAEIVRELLDYNPETGDFYWKHRDISLFKTQKAWKLWNCRREGKIAGSIERGYIRIGINGVSYWAHRLAWLYVYGDWPNGHIDHINGVKSDNNIDNLREATITENNRNVGLSKNNTSGFKGVTWNKVLLRWQAQISYQRKNISLGLYDCPIEAAKVYNKKAIELHGKFAKINDLNGVT